MMHLYNFRAFFHRLESTCAKAILYLIKHRKKIDPALVAHPALVARSGTGGAVCKGATPSVEQPGGRGFKPWLQSLLD
jgi:hypothetical protein